MTKVTSKADSYDLDSKVKVNYTKRRMNVEMSGKSLKDAVNAEDV